MKNNVKKVLNLMKFIISSSLICLQLTPDCKAQNSSASQFISCQYTVSLYDTFGDGWNGGYLDVLVNSLVVLDNITLNLGFGPVNYNFTINSNDQITTSFTFGGWPEENSYYIYNSAGVQVWFSPPSLGGPLNILPGQLIASCPPPELTPQVFSSAGAYHSNANCSLSITVGEPVIETYIAQDNALNTGFQQVETFVPLTKAWNGSFDDNWNVAGNWTAVGVPVSIDNVSIPATAPRMPVVRINGLSCRSVGVATGASLTINTGSDLKICGN